MLQTLHAEPSPGPGFVAMHAIHALPGALLALHATPATSSLPMKDTRSAATDPDADAAAAEARLGRLLESAMRVIAVVVLLCLAAAWLGPVLAGHAWPEPPAAAHPADARLEASGVVKVQAPAPNRRAPYAP